MSSLTISDGHASMGVWSQYSSGGGLVYRAREFVSYGSSLVTRVDYGYSGFVAYYVDGVSRLITDGTFTQNKPEELFTHSESDGDHAVQFYDQHLNATNTFTVTSPGGVASFRLSDNWGEVAAIADLTSHVTSLPAYITDDAGSQAFSTFTTYGSHTLHEGGSFRWKGSGTTIRVYGRQALSSRMELFKDGVSQGYISSSGLGWETDNTRFFDITGLDGAEHEWCLYGLEGQFSIYAVSMGAAGGTGTFNHSPTFLPRKKALVIGDSTSTAFGILFTDVWVYKVFCTRYWVLTNAAIGGTSVRDYTIDGTHDGEPSEALFKASSAEALVESTYKNFTTIEYDAIVLSDGANDNCSGANFTASCDAIIDDLIGRWPDTALVMQPGTTADGYDTALANSVTYGTGAYPSADIRLGHRPAGVEKGDGIHPTPAGHTTIANDFLSEEADLFAAPAAYFTGGLALLGVG